MKVCDGLSGSNGRPIRSSKIAGYTCHSKPSDAMLDGSGCENEKGLTSKPGKVGGETTSSTQSIGHDEAPSQY